MPLEWLPDETLFGLASRFHIIAGNRLAEQTCMELFGHPRQGTAHDLPARVDEFVRRTKGAFGNAEIVIREHTLLPFYLPFRTDHDASSATNALRSGCLGGIKARLGLLASRFGASHPLKSCVDCMAEDVRNYNVSFWHLEHQWPGAWVCLRHGTLLRYGLGKVNAEARFDWLMPADLAFSQPLEPAAQPAAMPTLVRLSACACSLGRLPAGFHFQTLDVVRAYRARLSELGLATATGRLRIAEFGETLSKVCLPLSKVYGLGVLSSGLISLARQFGRLAHDARPRTHPLRHLILIVALFDSWHAFLEEYRRQAGDVPGRNDVHQAQPGSGDAAQDPRPELVAMGVDRGLSVTAAAHSAGVAVATAMAWLAKAGQDVRGRPKKLRADLRAAAIGQLRKGNAKTDVAEAVGVSVQTITRLLRTQVALSTQWKCAKHLRRQRTARAAWRRAAKNLAFPNAKNVRAHIPADFAWLYRNDREWLQQACASLPVTHRTHDCVVNWEQRDRDLATEIRSVARALRATHRNKRLKLSELCNAIPRLKPLLSKSDKLPLTRSAIQEARDAEDDLRWGRMRRGHP